MEKLKTAEDFRKERDRIMSEMNKISKDFEEGAKKCDFNKVSKEVETELGINL